MSHNAPKQKISFVRLFILLLIFAAIIGIGTRYVFALVTDFNAATPSTWFAPYVDVTLTPIMHFEEPSEQLSDDIVLGFIVADPTESCQPSWGTYYTLDAAARALDLDRRIVRLQERGGHTIASFGGAINNELATVCTDVSELTAAYQAVINRYNLQTIDFDIEGAAINDQAANSRRVEAIRQLQQQNKELEVWFTLPVAPHGLSIEAMTLVNELVQADLELTGVNLMTMNYAESREVGVSMQEANVRALTAVNLQLQNAYNQAGKPKTEQELWQHIGATPMIGQNDVATDIFKLEDAHALVTFAQSHNLGRLSFWSINRDAPCGAGIDGGRVSNTCSGVEQESFEFTAIFANGSIERTATVGNATTKTSPSATNENGSSTAFRDDPQTSPYPLWRPAKAYEANAKVVWQGRVYQAKWWSEGNQPDAPVENIWETPWRYLGPVLESDREAVRQAPEATGNWTRWIAENVYVAGDEVEYSGQVFRAKWYSQGDTPNEEPDQPFDHAWEYLGDVDCTGDNCLGSANTAALTIDYKSLPHISLEIREDDGVSGTSGELVQTHVNQSGQKTYEVLQGTYDLVFQMAATEFIVDSITCQSNTCDNSDIATTLSIDYGGLTNIQVEVRTNDGVEGTAGELVQTFSNQSGKRSYSVLRGNYDLVFDAGTTELIIDAVTCQSSSCEVNNISTILSIDYDGLTNIHTEIRVDDGIDKNSGTLVQAHDGQRGQKSYHVLRGSYDLLFEQGAAELIIDAFDCNSSHCTVTDITAELSIDYGDLNISMEIRTADGQSNTVGGFVEAYSAQSGSQLYKVLRGSYDIVMKTDGSTKVHDTVDCSGKTCFLSSPWYSLVD